jgi:hypothetical protein
MHETTNNTGTTAARRLKTNRNISARPLQRGVISW